MLDHMTYLARWPDYFHVAEGSVNKIMGYLMGKVEGQGESWHSHVTAVTATEYRRQQLAKKLMNLLEDFSDKIFLSWKLPFVLGFIMRLVSFYGTVVGLLMLGVSDMVYFVDLFVRASNTPALKMYEKLGYVIDRRVLRYYSG